MISSQYVQYYPITDDSEHRHLSGERVMQFNYHAIHSLVNAVLQYYTGKVKFELRKYFRLLYVAFKACSCQGR